MEVKRYAFCVSEPEDRNFVKKKKKHTGLRIYKRVGETGRWFGSCGEERTPSKVMFFAQIAFRIYHKPRDFSQGLQTSYGIAP
jgi:hypothetical protein